MLNKNAPLRKKFLRANHAPYITKTLRKAIMNRPQLESNYIKNTKTFVVNYTKRREENIMSP